MDCEEFDRRAISAEALSLSEARRTANLKMLAENGYVQGLDVHKGPQGNVTISMHRPPGDNAERAGVSIEKARI